MKESVFVKKTEEFSKKLCNNFIKKILVFDEVSSTNTIAKKLAATGAQEIALIIAHTQTEGRGRFRRIWQSPKGGVYVSFLLRPTIPIEKTPLLPLVAALCISRSIANLSLHATIKWPNDIRVNGKKIAGILLESDMDSHAINYVVVGIGVNLNIDIMELSEDIRAHSTSVSNELGRVTDYYKFLSVLLVEFEDCYKLLLARKYEQIIEEWKKQSDTIGKKIQIRTLLESIEGIADDVDETGFLIVRTNDGGIKKITSGDCVYFDELQHS